MTPTPTTKGRLLPDPKTLGLSAAVLLCCAALRLQAAPDPGVAEPEPGDALTPVDGGPLHRIWGTGPDNIWAVGASGSLARWNGRAFIRLESTAHDHLRSLWGTGPDNIWAVGCTESVHWDGHAARLVPSANGLCLSAVWGSDPSHAWAVGRGATLLRLDDTGELRREPIALPDAIELTSIWGSGPTDVWVVGQQGTILHGDGQSFRPVNPGSAFVHVTLQSVWGSGPNDLWIVGEAGVIMRFDGVRWQRLRSGSREKLHAVWGSRSDDVWVVGDGGLVLHWNGSVLLPIHEGGAANFWSVWGYAAAAGREVFIAGPEGPLRHRSLPAPAPGSPCEPASRRCQGDAIEVCSGLGTSWRPLTRCANSCTAGTCAPPKAH